MYIHNKIDFNSKNYHREVLIRTPRDTFHVIIVFYIQFHDRIYNDLSNNHMSVYYGENASFNKLWCIMRFDHVYYNGSEMKTRITTMIVK